MTATASDVSERVKAKQKEEDRLDNMINGVLGVYVSVLPKDPNKKAVNKKEEARYQAEISLFPYVVNEPYQDRTHDMYHPQYPKTSVHRRNLKDIRYPGYWYLWRPAATVLSMALDGRFGYGSESEEGYGCEAGEHAAIVKRILVRGANPNEKFNLNQTAWRDFIGRPINKIVSPLQFAFALPNISPLPQQEEVLLALLEAGADHNFYKASGFDHSQYAQPEFRPDRQPDWGRRHFREYENISQMIGQGTAPPAGIPPFRRIENSLFLYGTAAGYQRVVALLLKNPTVNVLEVGNNGKNASQISELNESLAEGAIQALQTPQADGNLPYGEHNAQLLLEAKQRLTKFQAITQMIREEMDVRGRLDAVIKEPGFSADHEVKHGAEQEQQQEQIKRAQVMHDLLQEARVRHWSEEEKKHRKLMTAYFDTIRNRHVAGVGAAAAAAAAAPAQPSDDASKPKSSVSGSAAL